MEKSRTARNKNKKRNFISIFFLIVLGLSLVFFAYGYNILRGFSRDSIQPKKVKFSDPVNILILGVDAGDYNNKSQNNPKRSDTMLLIRYVPKNDKVFMLSIPRDTRVNINGHAAKINSAHAVGGPKTAIEAVEKLLGIEINYYVRIDYEGFRKCIDAIGGIDVIIPRNMDYDANDIHIHFKKGEKIHLDGKGAEAFVRWRKNNDGSGYEMGDLGRQETQQEFILKIIEKLKTPSGIIRFPLLMNTVSKYIKTNLEPEDILIYALKLKNIDVSKIERKMLQGEPQYIGGVSYFIYNGEKNVEYLKNFRGGISTDKVEIDRSDIKVTVLNAAGESGLASKYKDELIKMGYKIVETGNYPRKINTSMIRDYSLKDYGHIVQRDLNFGNVIKMKENSGESEVVVILGRDSVK